MKHNSKILISAIALATALAGSFFPMGVKAASSASWAASHVNFQGVPAYESVTADITIQHGKKGASVICNSASHSNSQAYTGYTNVSCFNFYMPSITITNTGAATCLPSTGDPIVDIDVRYLIGAQTPTADDTYRCSGSISKIY